MGEMFKMEIDGCKLSIPKEHVNAGAILIAFSPYLKYMSTSAMLHALKMTAGILEDLGVAKRDVTSLNNTIDRFREEENPYTEISCLDQEYEKCRFELMDSICEYIMRSEGHGRLHGFGFVSFETTEDATKRVCGVFQINPEKTPVNFL